MLMQPGVRGGGVGGRLQVTRPRAPVYGVGVGGALGLPGARGAAPVQQPHQSILAGNLKITATPSKAPAGSGGGGGGGAAPVPVPKPGAGAATATSEAAPSAAAAAAQAGLAAATTRRACTALNALAVLAWVGQALALKIYCDLTTRYRLLAALLPALALAALAVVSLVIYAGRTNSLGGQPLSASVSCWRRVASLVLPCCCSLRYRVPGGAAATVGGVLGSLRRAGLLGEAIKLGILEGLGLLSTILALATLRGSASVLVQAGPLILASAPVLSSAFCCGRKDVGRQAATNSAAANAELLSAPVPSSFGGTLGSGRGGDRDDGPMLLVEEPRQPPKPKAAPGAGGVDVAVTGVGPAGMNAPLVRALSPIAPFWRLLGASAAASRLWLVLPGLLLVVALLTGLATAVIPPDFLPFLVSVGDASAAVPQPTNSFTDPRTVSGALIIVLALASVFFRVRARTVRAREVAAAAARAVELVFVHGAVYQAERERERKQREEERMARLAALRKAAEAERARKAASTVAVFNTGRSSGARPPSSSRGFETDSPIGAELARALLTTDDDASDHEVSRRRGGGLRQGKGAAAAAAAATKRVKGPNDLDSTDSDEAAANAAAAAASRKALSGAAKPKSGGGSSRAPGSYSVAAALLHGVDTLTGPPGHVLVDTASLDAVAHAVAAVVMGITAPLASFIQGILTPYMAGTATNYPPDIDASSGLNLLASMAQCTLSFGTSSGGGQARTPGIATLPASTGCGLVLPSLAAFMALSGVVVALWRWRSPTHVLPFADPYAPGDAATYWAAAAAAATAGDAAPGEASGAASDRGEDSPGTTPSPTANHGTAGTALAMDSPFLTSARAQRLRASRLLQEQEVAAALSKGGGSSSASSAHKTTSGCTLNCCRGRYRLYICQAPPKQTRAALFVCVRRKLDAVTARAEALPWTTPSLLSPALVEAVALPLSLAVLTLYSSVSRTGGALRLDVLDVFLVGAVALAAVLRLAAEKRSVVKAIRAAARAPATLLQESPALLVDAAEAASAWGLGAAPPLPPLVAGVCEDGRVGEAVGPGGRVAVLVGGFTGGGRSEA